MAGADVMLADAPSMELGKEVSGVALDVAVLLEIDNCANCCGILTDETPTDGPPAPVDHVGEALETMGLDTKFGAKIGRLECLAPSLIPVNPVGLVPPLASLDVGNSEA